MLAVGAAGCGLWSWENRDFHGCTWLAGIFRPATFMTRLDYPDLEPPRKTPIVLQAGRGNPASGRARWARMGWQQCSRVRQGGVFQEPFARFCCGRDKVV